MPTFHNVKISSLARQSPTTGAWSRVPWLRLSGRWLAALGFSAGAPVVVRAEPGRLIVELASSAPAPAEPGAEALRAQLRAQLAPLVTPEQLEALFAPRPARR